MYVTINYQLIEWIKQEKSINLSLREMVFISLIDSFRRQNEKCQMSQKTIGDDYLDCKETTVHNIIKKLKKENIIKVWYPPNQAINHVACTIWLHNDIRDIIKELQAVSKNDIGPVSKAVSKNDTNNKRIGDSGESSLEEDSPSSQEPEHLDTFLNNLDFDNIIKNKL